MKRTTRFSLKPTIVATIMPLTSIKINLPPPTSEEAAIEKQGYQEVGLMRAVAVNGSNELLRGPARVEAAKQLGLKVIPVLKIPPSLEHEYRPDPGHSTSRRSRRAQT